MIRPMPFKKVCKKCGYSKVIVPKSDVMPFMGDVFTCPKCKKPLQRKNANALEMAFSTILSAFKR
ncbi:hypothetical protein FPD38_04670 [Campylobacter volucris]|uniref:Uncharacterized protein n=1 Tax=Campylobacter volucris TaxID=1031542 RepID=A0A5C7DRN2_9BACT|nr:hypothetical protein [Campylobacter volucris]TXE88133.1 hypothetical protein FPD38_04670 [Campylobacter volucris]